MPGFTTADIRRGMDVYAQDGSYLGSILRIVADDRVTASTLPEPVPAGGFDGERIGPAPTQAIGNNGPRNQVDALRSEPPGNRLVNAIIVGRWHGLARRTTYPSRCIVTVSLERVVVSPL
jgi:hypothetical protein